VGRERFIPPHVDKVLSKPPSPKRTAGPDCRSWFRDPRRPPRLLIVGRRVGPDACAWCETLGLEGYATPRLRLGAGGIKGGCAPARFDLLLTDLMMPEMGRHHP